MDNRKIIGITMGDPQSVGPEISAKALGKAALYEQCKPLIIGSAWSMAQAVKCIGREDLKINAVSSPAEGKYQYGIIDVLDIKTFEPEQIKMGVTNEIGGEASFQYVIKVIDLALKGEVAATITNALSKEAINMAGHHYAGHTEIYAEYTNTSRYCMMLAHHNLRVAHVSTHVSLREAINRCKKDRVLEVIRIADRACRDMGVTAPKIAVAGLNPHAGENGMFGTEEIEEIIPAIKIARDDGLDVTGPVPPDTVFSKARGGWFDVVVVMYHDQGHIPLKLAGFVYNHEKGKWDAVEGVNITLGLPIIRVSVDHGTAFGHAGQGRGNELSLENAIAYGILFANNTVDKLGGK